MVFGVASWFHIDEPSIALYRASDLVWRYMWIEQEAWGRAMEQVSATELGVSRALAQLLSKKKVPELPTYEEAKGAKPEELLPEWHRRFEAANPDRGVRV